MNSKTTTNSQLSTTELKTKPTKNELSKLLEQEQNHRNGDDMEGYQQGAKAGRIGGKVQGIRNINGPRLVGLSGLSASLQTKGSLV